MTRPQPRVDSDRDLGAGFRFLAEGRPGHDLRLRSFRGVRHYNASGPEPIQVFIDPVRLNKTVQHVDGAGAYLIDGPFVVTMTVENALTDPTGLVTTGLVNVLLPSGFTILGSIEERVYTFANGAWTWSDTWVAIDDRVVIENERITIRGANLGSGVLGRQFRYTLLHQGDEVGVSFVSLSAEYRYLYVEDGQQMNVILRFPQPVVGLNPNPDRLREDENRTFEISEGIMLDVLGRTLDDLVFDGGYFGFPQVLLLGANPDGVLVEDGLFTADVFSNMINFTPTGMAVGSSVDFLFEIVIEARRGNSEFNLRSAPQNVRVTRVAP